LDWPAGTARLDQPFFLTIEAEAPLDSLGLQLRWAAREAGGRVEVTGVRAAAGSGWRFTAPAERAVEGHYNAVGAWSVDRDFLESVAVVTPGGRHRYQIGFDAVFAETGAVRLEVANLTVRSAAGDVRQLGRPGLSIGDGWLLELPPVITSISGRLNWRFIRSTITLRGVDLHRLVRIVLIDSKGKRVHPRYASTSRERVDLFFANKAATLGWCDLEIGTPEGTLDTLRGAIELAMLQEPQPTDTNLGVIPESGDR
jgi:hypothetical protein